MKEKTTLTSILVLALMGFVLPACIHRSTLPIDPSAKRSEVFEYCGGQQWGFAKALGEDVNPPYQAVYIEFDVIDRDKPKPVEYVALNFVIHSLSDLKVQFHSRKIKIFRDDQVVHDKVSNFWTIRGEKPIFERYSSDEYTYDLIPQTNNEWAVRKKKFGGFFGQMLLEEPFRVKIEKYPNLEMKTDSIELRLEDTMNELYVLEKILVPFGSSTVTSSQIKAVIPAYTVNGISVPETTHVFHFKREQILENMKKSRRCASMTEIFRSARNKKSFNPLTWLLTPIIVP